MKHFFSVSLAVSLGLCLVPSAHSQNRVTPSLERAQCSFPDQKDVVVEYTGMQRDGRNIFGEVVPYGKVWKLGSDNSPTFVTSTTLVMEGKEVPAGHYHLSVIPSANKWTLILRTNESNNLSDAGEATKIDLTTRQLRSPVDRFTIFFDQVRGGCVFNIRWDGTEASALLAEKK